MTAQTILPANTLSSGFDVANSARFESAQLLRTNTSATATDIDKYTISVWLKRSKLGVDSNIIADTDGSNNYYQIYFKSDDTIRWQEYLGGSQSGALITNRKFRDVGAWYNLIFRYDSSLGTAGDRMRMYVNGVEETSFSTDVNPSQNANGHFGEASSQKCIADNNADGREYFGYMCEYIGVDGQSLAPTEFGEFDEDSGIWKPIDISGITQGVHGFYLKFEDSSDLGVATLGSNWTGAGLAATDQSTDTCTNNFCTINSLDNFYAASTLSEGNLKVLTISGNAAYNPATFGLIKGKWYWEVKLVTCSNGDGSEATIIGISNQSPVNAGYSGSIVVNDGIGIRGNGKAWGADGSSGGGQETSGWDAIAVGNTAMIAVDFDNGKLYHGINGTWGNSGDPTSGSSGTGAYAFTVGTDVWFPGVNQRETSQTATFDLNFGSPPYAISSGNQDADGFGNFEYAVPSGYFALNTKNLAEYG